VEAITYEIVGICIRIVTVESALERTLIQMAIVTGEGAVGGLVLGLEVGLLLG
jgi:hypothetical protein